MTTNRLVEKEKAAAYASALLNGAQELGGQDAVMEVRDQALVLLSALRGNADLNEALANESLTGSERFDFAQKLFGISTRCFATLSPSWRNAARYRC